MNEALLSADGRVADGRRILFVSREDNTRRQCSWQCSLGNKVLYVIQSMERPAMDASE